MLAIQMRQYFCVHSRFCSKELTDHWKKFYTSVTSLEMFPDPNASSVADDISHHMATEEIVGVGKLLALHSWNNMRFSCVYILLKLKLCLICRF